MVTKFFLLVKLLLTSTANVTHCMQTLPTNTVTTACSALAGLRELVRMISTLFIITTSALVSISVKRYLYI